MKIAFLIGTNDVGGAEFVSYYHVMMVYRNGLDMIVLSGTTGKFYDLIKNAGVRIEVVGMNPVSKTLAPFLIDCDVVFNCNFFGVLPVTIELKKRIGFRHLLILHNDTHFVNSQVVKYDAGIDGYYAIHQKIVNSCTKQGIVSEQKFVVIPNCVDVELITLAMTTARARRGCFATLAMTTGAMTTDDGANIWEKYGFKDTDFVIGMITRVAQDKNILGALNIFSKLPESMNARLLIIGGASANTASENYFKKVKKTINGDIRLSRRIKITGNMNTKDVYTTMTAFDIGLNCSPSEGLPIALLEMMGAGIPCVMPSIGDIPDVLTGRGVVIPIRQRFDAKEIYTEPCYSPQEINLFANAINKMHQNRETMAQMGKDAALYVSEFRSLQYQEKLFLKFIDMKKTEDRRPKSEAGSGKLEEVNDKAEGEVASQARNDASQARNDASQDRNDNPKVSVLMPTRDGNEEWINQAIESIANQKYAGELELVVVNHDCRISMIKKLDQMITKFREIMVVVVVIVEDDDVSFSEALDMGVEKCSGDIIIRMDHDDIAEPELVSKLVDFMGKNPDIAVCGVQIKFFAGKEIITHHPATVTKQLAANMANWWFVNHPGVAIRKSELLKVGGYGKTKQGYAEDYHLWCKFLKAGYVIANLPDVLVHYRCYKKDRIRPSDFIESLEKEKAGLRK